ncbi:hypothetical protein K450DRAFT_239740 [Umbelopsis ramanniana AG]|uniref:Mei2-like C-terminal RNA recognition motif domain-containing protein n=1 Tax=Umbelopsis ramanniana AG TaxID=1314678 RepID=A0AAD5EAP5_UMBRA|nr:uncharacterized protein K450DRAFT_239740 [Umbelopsis ramanniana AG]KAI8579922.1 hypothetical protein K450DRAFT_239740 [Umbelopsis ramanniana AG]
MSHHSSAQMAAMMMVSIDDRFSHHRTSPPHPFTPTSYPSDTHLFYDHSPSSTLLPNKESRYTVPSSSKSVPWLDLLYRLESGTMNASDSSGTSSDSSHLSDHPFAQFSGANGRSAWTSSDLTMSGIKNASRAVHIRNIASHVNEKALLEAIQMNGDLKAIWAEHLHTRHEMIVVYFDVRDAYRLVLKAALAIQESDPFYGTWVTYCTAEQMSKIHGINIQKNSEFMVRVSGHDLSLATDILARFGSLQSLCPNPLFYSDRQIFVGEYFDERSAIKATQELHNHIIQERRTEYGAKQQETINAFLQRLKTFKHMADVKLEDVVDTPLPESEDDSAKSKPPGRTTSPTINNEIDIDRILMGLDKRTTCMIRNIPNKYTQQMLIECINTTHNGAYDFLYLRIDFKNKCNVGYAFINFIELRSLVTFAQQRVGRKWNRFNSEKRCTLSYANIQGKKALVEKFRNSSVMDEEASYQPKIFVSTGVHRGEEEPFPQPTLPSELRKRKQRLTSSHRSSTFLDYYRHNDTSNSGDD